MLFRSTEQEMYRQVEREFGKSAVAEVKTLINQLRKDHRELNDEFYRNRMQARREWGGILLASAMVYGLLKSMGLI